MLAKGIVFIQQVLSQSYISLFTRQLPNWVISYTKLHLVENRSRSKWKIDSFPHAPGTENLLCHVNGCKHTCNMAFDSCWHKLAYIFIWIQIIFIAIAQLCSITFSWNEAHKINNKRFTYNALNKDVHFWSSKTWRHQMPVKVAVLHFLPAFFGQCNFS